MPTLRDSTVGDLPNLLGMMRQLYESDGIPFDGAASNKASLELIANPALGRLWQIESNSRPAGYLVVTFGFSLEYGGLHGFIDELFIAADFRGRGLGSIAVEYASAFCKSQGMKAILLEVDLHNPRAHSLYERLSFHENRRRLMTRIL